MAKTIPTSYTAPTYTDVIAGASIEAVDWTEEIEGLHHLWSRAGARVPLYLRTDDPFEITSTTYTRTDAGTTTSRDLTVQTGVLQLSRPIVVSSASQHRLVLAVYGQNVDVRATVFAPDGNTTLGTIDASCGGTWQWATGTLDISDVNALEGGSAANPYRTLGVDLQAKVPSTGTGFLWQALAHDAIAVASQLPDGS